MKSDKRMDEKIRHRVFIRDKYTCRYCGSKKGPFHADHVYPYIKGGETSTQNLVTACQHCNSKKGSRIGVWPKPIGYFEKKKSNADATPYRLILFGTILIALIVMWFYVKYSIPIPLVSFIFVPIMCIWTMLIFIWPE